MRATIGSKYTRLLVLPACITVIVVLALGLIACDPGESVIIENRTGETVAVFDDGTQRNLIASGDTARYSILKFEHAMTFTVKTMDGKVLASRTFTWDEITAEGGMTIVVEE